MNGARKVAPPAPAPSAQSRPSLPSPVHPPRHPYGVAGPNGELVWYDKPGAVPQVFNKAPGKFYMC